MIYREMREGDEQAVSRLVQKSFHRYIANTYTSEGVDNFLEETSPWGIAERKRKGQLIIVAEEGKGKGNRVIVGVIVVRSGNHISLFFVDEAFHKRGVARTLLEESTRKIRETVPGVSSITVNSSPSAVGFYEKMGFHRTGPEQYRKGMLVNPMMLHLR